MLERKNVKYPVEYLIFQVHDSTPEIMEKYVQLDHDIWTKYLASKPGFVSKEVFINEDTPGEVHQIIIWETLESWKSIPLDELKEVVREFDNSLGTTYDTVRRVHKETNHKLYKVRHYEID